jgi:hypothetical protein
MGPLLQLAACVVVVAVNDKGSGKGRSMLTGYYMGCELPGAIKNCAEIMKDADYGLLAMRSVPATGPTQEMKIAALEAQDKRAQWWNGERAEHVAAAKFFGDLAKQREDSLAKRAGAP